ncbi:MAG: DUF5103 domain-containing protein, partial [Muribaculaceae bacterium]|nr:DUF5103 domain-containing protein [Muribaculaceae bacterium]
MVKLSVYLQNIVRIVAACMFGIGASNLYALNPEQINDPLVKSLTVRNPENFMAPPVIRLNTADRLDINFDIIGEDAEHLRYRLLHCNADWQPSRLLEQEYLKGFNEAEIEDYAFSSNTFIHYVNYNLEIPNSQMQPVAGGNYLLQVYRENYPDEILFQTGFYVSENTVTLQGDVTTRTDKGVDAGYQQVELRVDAGGEEIRNPWQDLVVNVIQNNSPSSLRTTFHPLRVEGKVIEYAHDPNLIFPAGNEYRRFETVRTDYPGMHVDSVVFNGKMFEAYLTPDLPRAGKGYEYDRTQHGRFKIDDYNSTDANLGADYVLTHFSLIMPYQPGADIYPDGEFTRYN